MSSSRGVQVRLSPELGSRMWVFREGKRRANTAAVWADLRKEIARHPPAMDILLRAGELEAGLADAGHASAEVARITDAAALALVGEQPVGFPQVSETLEGVSEEITIGTPEGFAFYLVHPLSFRELARQVHDPAVPAAVIGIRSIGATLSAVVAATVGAQRITVRPTGHPYQRTTRPTAEQQHWIASQRRRGAIFYVVDEGPGFSGSSLLSVCQALEEAGVPAQRITILCTADIPATNHTATRWRRYHSAKAAFHLPPELRDEKWYNADHWRMRIFGGDENIWPGVWKNVETAKFLARDDHRLFRFIGYAHYGSAVLNRYNRLFQAGLGPEAKGGVEGFAEFRMEGGAAFAGPRWNEKTHEFMVRYLAGRAELCPADAEIAERNLAEVRRMVHFNTKELLGEALDVVLTLERPIYADNRMQPHKFMRTPYGMRKLDGAAHGDDHFFPGPCDIAWDIAGLAAEWQLTGPACEALLRDYSSRTGDSSIRSRLGDWTIAYLAFRCGFCLMGANAQGDTGDGHRLLRDAEHYLSLLRDAVSRVPARRGALA